MSTLKTIARKTGLARIYHLLYRVPKNSIAKSIREGGPYEQLKTQRGREAMRQAANDMPQLLPPSGEQSRPLKTYFLTGEDFWYQTLFCFASLQHHSDVQITPVIYSDGSLRPTYRERIRRVVPWAEFVQYAEIEAKLDAHLPRTVYPTLRERRLEYVHLRKLTDFHAGEAGWRLVLDSDMLFFDRPTVVLDWLQAPSGPFHMVDSEESYGYSRELMHSLVKAPIPRRVNVGFSGLRSEAIDWDQLEYWCRRMLNEEGKRYLQEQALTAMLMVGYRRKVAPRPDYLTLPSVTEGRSPSVILHHYVAESKRSYFQHGWRNVLSALNADTSEFATHCYP